MSGNIGTNEMRELSCAELDEVSGGLDIGPFHLAAGDGMVAVGFGGYGIVVGACWGVYGPGGGVAYCP
jgi:hypothetical protein